MKGSKPVKVIAEIGCNHKGDMDIAKELVEVAAKFCNADIVKFQKRTNRELFTNEEFNRPHPVPENAYGESYGLHREYLEFDQQQHQELVSFCASLGIEYSTSVWDLTAGQEMAKLNPPMLKIPSATNQHFELQGWLCQNYSGEIHVSTGMSTHDEIDQIVDFYKGHDRVQDLVLYACTSGYPVPMEEVCLLEIKRLMQRYGNDVRGIGFSGHHLGIAADVAALAVGRMCELDGSGAFTHIERHFTLDRTWKGTDHAASLEPDGLRKLCRDIHSIDLALDEKNQEIMPIEEAQRDKLKWRAA